MVLPAGGPAGCTGCRRGTRGTRTRAEPPIPGRRPQECSRPAAPPGAGIRTGLWGDVPAPYDAARIRLDAEYRSGSSHQLLLKSCRMSFRPFDPSVHHRPRLRPRPRTPPHPRTNNRSCSRTTMAQPADGPPGLTRTPDSSNHLSCEQNSKHPSEIVLSRRSRLSQALPERT